MLKAKLESRHSQGHKEAFDEINKQKMHTFTVNLEEDAFLELKAKITLDKNYKSLSEFFRESVNLYLKK